MWRVSKCVGDTELVFTIRCCAMKQDMIIESTETSSQPPPELHCDEKVANREIRVWHFVIENGY
jgi:hypothetical protein